MNNKNRVTNMVIEMIGGLWFFLALISTVVLMVMNCTPIYSFVIDKYNLTNRTGLSADRLILNYKEIVSYLQVPGSQYLQLSDFAMSESGVIHFADVKIIFQALYVIVILFVIALGIFLVIRHHEKGRALLSISNKGANLAFIVFSLLLVSISVNFSETFTMFHKIFFRNDYWVFDYRTDPVILALPEQLFLILSVIIIGLLFAVCLLIKVIHYKCKKGGTVCRSNL